MEMNTEQYQDEATIGAKVVPFHVKQYTADELLQKAIEGLSTCFGLTQAQKDNAEAADKKGASVSVQSYLFACVLDTEVPLQTGMDKLLQGTEALCELRKVFLGKDWQKGGSMASSFSHARKARACLTGTLEEGYPANPRIAQAKGLRSAYTEYQNFVADCEARAAKAIADQAAEEAKQAHALKVQREADAQEVRAEQAAAEAKEARENAELRILMNPADVAAELWSSFLQSIAGAASVNPQIMAELKELALAEFGYEVQASESAELAA